MIDLETHEAAFAWLLQRLADAGLVKGKTVGIDATTLEANAALRSIVRRDSGESYQDFLTKLAQASGIETPAFVLRGADEVLINDAARIPTDQRFYRRTVCR